MVRQKHKETILLMSMSLPGGKRAVWEGGGEASYHLFRIAALHFLFTEEITKIFSKVFFFFNPPQKNEKSQIKADHLLNFLLKNGHARTTHGPSLAQSNSCSQLG